MKAAIGRIKENYGFTLKDEQLLQKLAPVMASHEAHFEEAFYGKAMAFSNAPKYLSDPAVIEKHRRAIRGWFSQLFTGPFDDDYLKFLEGIGSAHVKVELPSHYVNVCISFVRKFCADVIMKEVAPSDERADMLMSVGKILDINLDVLTSSYIEEEKNTFFISKKTESRLISFAERFSYGLNLILVMGLVVLGLTVLCLFAYDLTQIFTGSLEKGLLATLGALLMLWVVIELVDTEVEHLRGARFSIKVFVSVAMVAVIRKVLVTSLKTEPDALMAQATLIGVLAVLGLIYWIVSKTEKN